MESSNPVNSAAGTLMVVPFNDAIGHALPMSTYHATSASRFLNQASCKKHVPDTIIEQLFQRCYP